MSSMEISGAGGVRAYAAQTQATPQGTAQPGEEQAGAAQSKERQPAKTIWESMQEAREQAEKRKEALKLPKDGARYGYIAMEAYARLSRARNQAQVSSAAGYARRQILALKAAKRQDGDNARRIQAAINQLQKAVGRAAKKKNEIAREQLDEKRRARLEAESESRRAQRLRQDLQRRRTMRVLREGGYLREAEIDNRHQAQLAQTEKELKEQIQGLAPAAGPAADAAIRQYTAQAARLEAGAAGANQAAIVAEA